MWGIRSSTVLSTKSWTQLELNTNTIMVTLIKCLGSLGQSPNSHGYMVTWTIPSISSTNTINYMMTGIMIGKTEHWEMEVEVLMILPGGPPSTCFLRRKRHPEGVLGNWGNIKGVLVLRARKLVSWRTRMDGCRRMLPAAVTSVRTSFACCWMSTRQPCLNAPTTERLSWPWPRRPRRKRT